MVNKSNKMNQCHKFLKVSKWLVNSQRHLFQDSHNPSLYWSSSNMPTMLMLTITISKWRRQDSLSILTPFLMYSNQFHRKVQRYLKQLISYNVSIVYCKLRVQWLNSSSSNSNNSRRTVEVSRCHHKAHHKEMSWEAEFIHTQLQVWIQLLILKCSIIRKVRHIKELRYSRWISHQLDILKPIRFRNSEVRKLNQT